MSAMVLWIIAAVIAVVGIVIENLNDDELKASTSASLVWPRTASHRSTRPDSCASYAGSTATKRRAGTGSGHPAERVARVGSGVAVTGGRKDLTEGRVPLPRARSGPCSSWVRIGTRLVTSRTNRTADDMATMRKIEPQPIWRWPWRSRTVMPDASMGGGEPGVWRPTTSRTPAYAPPHAR